MGEEDAQNRQVDADLNAEMKDEFEALLADYRSASKQVLDSEREKAANMQLLNEQKEQMDGQNAKIQALKQQLVAFEQTLKEINSSNMQSNEQIMQKLEENLSSSK